MEQAKTFWLSLHNNHHMKIETPWVYERISKRNSKDFWKLLVKLKLYSSICPAVRSYKYIYKIAHKPQPCWIFHLLYNLSQETLILF